MSAAEANLESAILNKLVDPNNKAADEYPAITPECADLFLSEIRKNDDDDVYMIFSEYFTRESHNSFLGISDEFNRKILGALNCQKTGEGGILRSTDLSCCLPCVCRTLKGDRRLNRSKTSPTKKLIILFQARAILLFYLYRMGIFKILGTLLDDYATNGKYPMCGDRFSSYVMEMMVRYAKLGNMWSTRERAVLYVQICGWALPNSSFHVDTSRVFVNTAFDLLFDQFMIHLLAYENQKQLAEAINQTITTRPSHPSQATVVAVRDTISQLRKSMEQFLYGLNYHKTLNAIVWAIATLVLVKQLRDTIGIPSSLDRLDQIIPAAYNILVEKKSMSSNEPNRFDLHMQCAKEGRDVLMDLTDDAFDFKDGSQLKTWLNHIGSRVEAYRSACLALTGIDLGKPECRTQGTPKVQQQI